MSTASRDLLAAAEELAAWLCRHAVHDQDGSVSWSLVRQDDGRVRRIALGPHLGSGALGVAIFLAALDRVRGESEHREICLRAVARLRRSIARLDADAGAPAIRQAPGGMCGIGSVIYGLVTLGHLLADPELTIAAATICRHLDPAWVREEPRVDVMFGLAGLLLSLLALERAVAAAEALRRSAGGERPLDLAALCARRLIEASTTARDAGGAASPGYSHGAAGIASALARFAGRTGDPAARAAAEALLSAAEEGFAAPPPQRSSWCNGTAGLHIARLDALPQAGAEPPERQAASLGGLESASGPFDHLCCGGAGLADVMAHAARRLGAPALLAAARRVGAAILARHRQAGLRFPHPEILVEPRLLRGPTGVGYLFVRLVDPDLVPCVLAFE